MKILNSKKIQIEASTDIFILMFIMNIADFVLTTIAIALGIATEANPIMAIAMDYGALYFLMLKVFIGTICIYYLYAISYTAKNTAFNRGFMRMIDPMRWAMLACYVSVVLLSFGWIFISGMRSI